MKRRILLFLIITIVYLAGCSELVEWAHWRGPNGNGTTHDTDWSPEALRDGAKILWQADIGRGHSSVTVQGDRVYAMGNHRSINRTDTLEKDVVYCFNSKTGKILWTHEYVCAAGNWPGPGATPVIDQNYVYTISREGHLFCFDNRNGRILWQKHLTEDSLSTHRFYSNSAVIDGDILILNYNRAGLALNKSTGERVWTSPVAESGFSSPVLYDDHGGNIALLLTRRDLSAVDSRTGEQLWEHHVGWGTADPIVHDDKILFAGQSTALYRFTRTGLEEIWKNDEIRWQFQSPVVVNDHIYGLSWCHHLAETQPLHCIDLATGEVVWKEDLVVWGALIAADDKLLIIEGQGRLVIAEASPDGYRVLHAAQAVPMSDNTSLPNTEQCHCWTHPVLVGGKLYARNNYGALICVDMRI